MAGAWIFIGRFRLNVARHDQKYLGVKEMNISDMSSIQHHVRCERQKCRTMKQQQLKGQNRQYSKSLVLVLSGILGVTSTANAELPSEMEVFGNLQEVSDGELGEMRGKFASNNAIVYFGVDISSGWQTANGSLATASANLSIDLSDASTPKVHYVPTITIVEGQVVPANQQLAGNVSGGAGLQDVSGVSQSIQVAGFNNKINNDIAMQVRMFSTMQGGSIADSAQTHAGTVSKTASDGTVVTVALTQNSIALNMNVPGQGQVMQELRNQGILQAVRIGGDLNHIHNQITMQVGLSTVSGLNSSGINAAFQSLKLMPQPGVF